MTSTSSPSFEQIHTGQVAKRCEEETQRFFKTGECDDRYGRELFRRAIELEEVQAWNEIYRIYTPIVTGWIYKHSMFAKANEEVEFFINRTFARLWKAMNPDRFSQMRNFKALMAYIKMCSHSAIMEYVERRMDDQELVESDFEFDILATRQSDQSPSEEIEEAMSAQSIWNLILEVTKSDQERLIARCTLALDMTPREIFDQNLLVFDSIKEVYRTKENLFNRLKRNKNLQSLWEDA